MPEFLREQLSIGKKENNIFTNSHIEFNEDYSKAICSILMRWLACNLRLKKLLKHLKVVAVYLLILIFFYSV